MAPHRREIQSSRTAQIQPVDLKELLDRNGSVCLIDVRQPEEHQLVRIENSHLFPVDQLQSRLEDIRGLVSAENQTVVVYCRSGGRSEMAIRWLQSQGIAGLKNLRGGINAYAKEADSRLKPY